MQPENHMNNYETVLHSEKICSELCNLQSEIHNAPTRDIFAAFVELINRTWNKVLYFNQDKGYLRELLFTRLMLYIHPNIVRYRDVF